MGGMSGGMGGMGGMSGGMGGMGGGIGGMGDDPADDENRLEANVFTFVIQMAWQPRSVAERIEARRVRVEAETAAKTAADAAAAAAAGTQ